MDRFDRIRTHLERAGLRVILHREPTPTVSTAAAALGCREAEIAKTILLLVGAEPVAVLAAGDRKVSSSHLKQATGLKGKVRMPTAEQVVELCGDPAGGVCPFLLPTELPLLLDVSLQRFMTVFPAAGHRHSAVAVPVARLEELTDGRWAEVCRPLAGS